MLCLETASLSSTPCCHRLPRTPPQSHQLRQSCSWTSLSTGHRLAGGPCLRLLCPRYHQLHLQVLCIRQKPLPCLLFAVQATPLPFSKCSTCLFATFLAQQGLKPQSISVYLSALRHLEVSAGLDPPLRAAWPRLQYVLRGIKRSQDSASNRVRLPITTAIMHQLRLIWANAPADDHYQATMLWAACCLGYFGFMRAGEFSAVNSREPGSILVSDVAVDSHTNPSVVRVFLWRAKADPFGEGVSLSRQDGLPRLPHLHSAPLPGNLQPR